MGGLGSGQCSRWRETKGLVQDYSQIDVRHWHREGLLGPRSLFTCNWLNGNREKQSIRVFVGSGEAVLLYRLSGVGQEREDVVEPVALTWTRCNYGGERPWFTCPGVVNGRPCRRRVAKLYLRGRYFLCRQCHGLAYHVQREDRVSRLVHRAQKIRTRLGAEPSFVTPLPDKPARMHWSTYRRLVSRAVEAEMAVCNATNERILWLLNRLGCADF